MGALRAIDRAADRAAHLRQRLGIDEPDPPADRPRRPRPMTQPVPMSTWKEIVETALASGHEQASFDGLVSHDQARRIDEQHRDGFALDARLDAMDIAAAVTAGVTAALLDFLIVDIPRTSDLTRSLRDLGVDSHNWLSGIAKVPYDQVTGTGIDGMGPTTHRVQTLGHDPLLGWVYGTLDILRGSLTGGAGESAHWLNQGPANAGSLRCEAVLLEVLTDCAAAATQRLHQDEHRTCQRGWPRPDRR